MAFAGNWETGTELVGGAAGSVLYAGPKGLTRIAGANDPIPGLPGTQFGSLFAGRIAQVAMNNLNEIVFAQAVKGTKAGDGLFLAQPEAGAPSMTEKFTVVGYFGVGTDAPSRAFHVSGPNAVFRLDRSSNSAAFMLVRTTQTGLPIKSFVVGVNASDFGQGEFLINDLGRYVGGNGRRRLTITTGGDAVFDGGLAATSFFQTSSRNLKTNILPLSDTLRKTMNLRGVQFDWMDSGKPGIGLIAEEVETLFPQLVLRNPDSVPQVNYRGLLVVLIETYQELQRQVDALARQKEQLRQKLNQRRNLK